jgi:hypothetical protein
VLNDQIVTVTERMNMHLSLLPIFSALEQNVSQSLRLKSLEYVRENDAPPKVTIEGTANIVGSILFQRELFADNPLFEQAQFTEVDIASAPKDDEDGSALDEVVTVVTFDMAAVMPIELLRYTPSSVRDSIPESLESDAMGSSTQEFDQNEAAVELLSEEEISS